MDEDPELIPVPDVRPGVRVRLLDLNGLGDLDRAAARHLSPGEAAEFAAMKFPKRRREWLGARVCLKRLLIEAGFLHSPADADLVKGPRGRPLLRRLRPAPAGGDVRDCSISHAGDFACAGISTAPTVARVGVDVERVDARTSRLRGEFVNPADRMDSASAGACRDTVLWSVKEAASKALGMGLGIGFRDVVCDERQPGRCAVSVASGPEIDAHYRFHLDYVVAIALIGGEGS